MTLAIVACDDVPKTPWKNGGGFARDLLSWPDSFDWALRISVADVERDGPFSDYAGVERWFAVLEGTGVTLSFADNGEKRILTRDDPPFRFDGARALHCTLASGPTRDFNVMFAHDRGEGSCAVVQSGQSWRDDSELRAIFSVSRLRLVLGDDSVELPPMSLAWSRQLRGQTWRVDDGGRAFWIAYRTKVAR
ncbi:MAG TPA: HutD family protein [Casimicrobiaceae bacterium]|nr:HutD family protein [Casimicrobiaceae bacterium]